MVSWCRVQTMLRWEDHEGHIRMTSCFSPNTDGRTTVRYILKVSIVGAENCILSNDHSSLRAKQWDVFLIANTQKVSLQLNLTKNVLQTLHWSSDWLVVLNSTSYKYLFEQIQTLPMWIKKWKFSSSLSLTLPFLLQWLYTHTYSYNSYYFLPILCSTQDLLSNQGLNSSCLQPDHGVPTTGLPQKSHVHNFLNHDGLMLLHFVLQLYFST